MVAMSGGLDSSMVAALLKEQGHQIVGVTMRVWHAKNKENTYDYFEDEINDALSIAQKFDFPHYVIDLQSDFYNVVVKDFKQEYLSGRTPNPCVVCNRHIKFGKLIEIMHELGCEKIATGHYAQIGFENNRYFLRKGKDKTKDQTYFMWNLTQESLSKILFPLGGFAKAEIREMAKNRGLTKISRKRESYDICFLPNMDYREFLELDKTQKQGDFILEDGTVLGKHKGIPNYTIGQRKGLNIGYKYPLYVIKTLPETNQILLGAKDSLMKKEIRLKACNLQKIEEITGKTEVEVKIRLGNTPVKADLKMEKETFKLRLHQPIFAITPGQSAVFYSGDDVVGGGFIV